MFNPTLTHTELTLYVTKQLNMYFPDGILTVDQLSKYVKIALKKIEYCFSKICMG